MEGRGKRLEVVYEDQWIVVISKPSGMLSVGYPGYRGKSAQDVLSQMFKSKGKRQITAVHRLDKDTSGIMIFALSAAVSERFMNDWQDIVSERIYRCVCERVKGRDDLEDAATIDLPIAYNRQHVGFVPSGKEPKLLKATERAVTRYKVLARGERYDLLECELETGRKNQIRIHLAHLGHPIVGDEVYGLQKSPPSGLSRLALHARVIAFRHPFTADLLRFEKSEPAEFLSVTMKAKAPRPVRNRESASCPLAARSNLRRPGKKKR